ncbi:MAG: RNA polymerase sigma factor [Candidatus Eisenbacteria bacterium]|uniref:RNA polymerase sigma factor n=1 Tax=Eiseniibacteriota bacterium TaxID=2212470 RepID=A0A849SQB0_UNCEI|nr:RNA polymerase sigma factor [Candidatus Eisenbacteria bacterium]
MKSPPSSEIRSDDLVEARRAAAGDVRAFERLYRQHVGRVNALARRMAGTEDAEELTQEVFVRAWERLESFRGDSAFGTWLHRVAINFILTRRTRRNLEWSRRDDTEGALNQVPARVTAGEHGIDFERAIGRLPSGARQIFVMHDVEGFKHEEIAEALGVTTGTTKAQLHRARMLLRGHLE